MRIRVDTSFFSESTPEAFKEEQSFLPRRLQSRIVFPYFDQSSCLNNGIRPPISERSSLLPAGAILVNCSRTRTVTHTSCSAPTLSLAMKIFMIRSRPICVWHGMEIKNIRFWESCIHNFVKQIFAYILS
jgi:hypothetical protein